MRWPRADRQRPREDARVGALELAVHPRVDHARELDVEVADEQRRRKRQRNADRERGVELPASPAEECQARARRFLRGGLGRTGPLVTCRGCNPHCILPAASMKFSPDYVRLVLDENFEDAKARLLGPLMAIEYAHLVMLADQEIVTRAEARVDPRGARRDLARRDPQGPLRRDLRGPLLLSRAAGRRRLRRGRGRAPAHRAVAQRHRHDDVPHVAAAVDPRRHRGHAGAAARADSARRPVPRRGVRRAHAHAAGAAVDRRALPAGRHRTARARHGAPRRRPTRAPTRIRSAPARSPAPGFRSIASARPRCSASTARPATPTAASRRSTTCSKA